MTYEENLKKLELAGIRCQKGDGADIAGSKRPILRSLKNSSLLVQLQWASVSIQVELFDTEKTLIEEIAKIRMDTGRGPYKYHVEIEDAGIEDLQILMAPKNGRVTIASEFGRVKRNGRYVAVHLKTYVRNMYKERNPYGSPDEQATNAIVEALEAFDIDKLTDATEEERKSLREYIKEGNMQEQLQAQISAAAIQAISQITGGQFMPSSVTTQITRTSTTTTSSGSTSTQTYSSTNAGAHTSTHTHTNARSDDLPSSLTSLLDSAPGPRINPSNTINYVPKSKPKPVDKEKHEKVVTADDIQKKMAELGKKKI